MQNFHTGSIVLNSGLLYFKDPIRELFRMLVSDRRAQSMDLIFLSTSIINGDLVSYWVS